MQVLAPILARRVAAMQEGGIRRGRPPSQSPQPSGWRRTAELTPSGSRRIVEDAEGRRAKRLLTPDGGFSTDLAKRCRASVASQKQGLKRRLANAAIAAAAASPLQPVQCDVLAMLGSSSCDAGSSGSADGGGAGGSGGGDCGGCGSSRSGTGACDARVQLRPAQRALQPRATLPSVSSATRLPRRCGGWFPDALGDQRRKQRLRWWPLFERSRCVRGARAHLSPAHYTAPRFAQPTPMLPTADSPSPSSAGAVDGLLCLSVSHVCVRSRLDQAPRDQEFRT
jgi:hypothetical protein